MVLHFPSYRGGPLQKRGEAHNGSFMRVQKRQAIKRDMKAVIDAIAHAIDVGAESVISHRVRPPLSAADYRRFTDTHTAYHGCIA